MTNTRRALVVTNETSRHPFRMSLPLDVSAASITAQKPAGRRWAGMPRITRTDLREFLMAYCAAFLAMMVFIS